jgi:hypothetical protein
VGNLVFTASKGRLVRYCDLATGSDAIGVMLLTTTGLVADTVLQDYTSVSSMLAGGNTEATFTNYVRKFFSSGITITPNFTTNTQTISMAGYTWSAAGGALNNTLGKLVTYYRQTSGSADSACVPMTFHDLTATTTGSDLLVSIASGNLGLAS